MEGRKILNFNTDWLFLPEDNQGAKNINFDDAHLEQVSLPHSNKILPHHYFEEGDYQFVSWYRRPFYLDNSYSGKRVLVEFDGVMTVAEVYVNGRFVGEHKGGYTSFKFDITEYVNLGGDNLLAVRVDSRQRKDVPPEGNLVDFLLFGGIYRDVRMVIVDPIYIDWAFYQTDQINEDNARVLPRFAINNLSGEDVEIVITSCLTDKEGNTVARKANTYVAKKGDNEIVQDMLEIETPRLWHPENPYLYNACTTLTVNGRIIDDYQVKIGIRQYEFGKDGRFYINGQPYKLRGLNRHQMFPYLGNAMPDRGQKKDAEILKYELGINFVRSSHYPADPSFLDRCDEIGLLVLEEIPGWQHIGNKAWKDISRKNVEEMIIRDRNHPSIFMWGVRINESPDDHDFYIATNRIAHSLDSTRPTCGIRNFQESEFLEDVFTYNDFELNLEGKIKQPNHIPYMITEYMGHMYPTKSYDSVERLIKHAIRHAQIQDKQYGIPYLAGASGWCAFDYNTHADFGSGDRVCYHGVCDMFRLPKFAAYFYRSQIDPDIEKVVFIARYLTPSFNEDYGDEVIVFSNCEEVDLYVGDKLISSARPNRVDYPNLPHPPFTFNNCTWWEWGASTISSLKAVGKIGGQEVVEHKIYPFGSPERLVLKPDYTELIADGSDCTRVVVELKDKNGQVLHLAHHPVFFELNGPGNLIGENPFSLEAGRGAIFIKTTRECGTISLTARVEGVNATSITINTTPLNEEIVPVTRD